MAQEIFQRGIGKKPRNFILKQPKLEEQYCRLCLSSFDTQFKQLFSSFNTTQSIVEVIEDIAKVTISQEDEYSKLICSNCFIRLTETENFKYLIENSDFKLRNPNIDYDSLDNDIADVDVVVDEDSDHEKIDVEELNLKKEIRNCGIELFDDQRNDLTENEVNNSLNVVETDLGDKLISSEIEQIESINIVKTKRKQKQIKNAVKKKRPDTDVKDPVKVKKKRIKKPYNLKCSECDKTFKWHQERKRHMISHTGIYPLYCSFCNKGFASKAELEHHEFTHTGKAKYQCEICGKGFKQSFNFSNHKLSHEGVKPFKCDQCLKEFKSKQILMMHIANKHSSTKDDPNFLCEICNKQYKTKFHLQSHMRRCHKPRELGTCNICGKVVPRLAEHVKTHLKLYKCTVCDMSFSTGTVLKAHSVVHTGQRQYECDICKKTFGFNGSLFKHKKTHDIKKSFLM